MATQSHDRFFKEFFRRFLERFLRLFFPEEAKQLDFSTLRFSNKEFVINFPEQAVRIGDVIAEINTLGGIPQAIIIHLEVEKWDKANLPRRSFEYYGLIRLLEHRPVLPLVLILTPGTSGLKWETYHEETLGRTVLHFEYGQVGLCDLLAEEYGYSDDPIAATLAVMMKVPGPEAAKWQTLADIKLHAMGRIEASKELTEGDKLFLIELIKRYLPTEKFPAGSLRGETMQALEERELFWYEKVQLEGQQIGFQKGQQIGFQEGQQAGRQIGQQIGQHKTLLRLLKRKFGALPADFLQQFEAINDPDLLDEIGDRLLTAQSLDQVLLPLAA